MNNVSIEFVIGIGNNKIAVTQNEARTLYGQLRTLFGDRTPLPYTPKIKDAKAGFEDKAQATVIDMTDKQYVEDPYTNMKSAKEAAIKSSREDLRERINIRLQEQKQRTGSGIDEKKIEEANNRVDKARERAAARTAGCGTKRSCS